MKIPLKPPTIEQFLDKEDALSQDQLGLIFSSDVGYCDEKGRYLHWEKVKYLEPPKGFSSELYWLAMKLARVKISKKLPFKDKHQKPFTYCIPDCVMRDILWISENATGAIEADPIISDEKTKQTYLINALIEEAINSSQLEGASTTRRVAKEMLRTGRAPTDQSEYMILNNHKAMKFIRNHKGDMLTPVIILKLHEMLVEETLSESDQGKAGAFRDLDDDIGVYSHDDVLLHQPPKADELALRLQLVCDFANNTEEDNSTFIPPILRAIMVHFMIGYDHPFVDGNGRTARALFYWIMANEGYWLMEYISISRVLNKSPSKYMYAYLHSETDENDMTYFIVHQLGVIREAIVDLHKHLIKKSKQLRDAEDLLENSSLKDEINYRQLGILKNAIENPGAEYTIRSHQTSHGITNQTARTDLLILSDKFGVLKKYRVGKTDVFVAPINVKEIISKIK